MTDKDGVTTGVSSEMEQMAMQRAIDRARNERWDLNILIFLFAVLIMVILLATYTKVGIEIVAPVAIFGLAMVWLVGWMRGKQLSRHLYNEELLKLEQELKATVKGTVEETIEETIEEKVQKALRQRWK